MERVVYRVIDCPWCPDQGVCDFCRGQRRVLCFPWVEVHAHEELRLFRVRYLGPVDSPPLVEFADDKREG
jgi:hypothetical protein